MARLRRAHPESDSGIRRIRDGQRFRYLTPDGRPVNRQTKERIVALAIPPAWTHVWISPDEWAHIQAIGRDALGRRQYIYHDRWRRHRDTEKFDRALLLAQALPPARSTVTRALRGGDERERVLAAAFRILDRTAVRMGSRHYLLRHGSRGLTTLRWTDVSRTGTTVSLTFPGKMQQRQHITFEDEDLAAWIKDQPFRPPRAFVLRFRENGRVHEVTATAVNDFIRTCTGADFTAKDFRTLRGTITAAVALAAHTDDDPVERERRAVDATATALGNTRAVARASYIDPRVLRAARRGRFIDPSVSEETGLLRLLD